MCRKHDLCLGIKVKNHLYQALLPFYVQGNLGLVHKQGERLTVLYQYGQEYDKNLFLSAGQLVGLQLIHALQKDNLVAVPLDFLLGILEQAVYDIKEMRLLGSNFLSLGTRLGITAGKKGHHTVGHAYLIVQIAALQLVQLEIQLAVQVNVCHLREDIA